MDVDLGRGESPQVRTKRIVAIIAGILAALALIAFGFRPLFPDRVGRTYSVAQDFPAPAVVPDEGAQRRALEVRQRRDLEGANGRMPIGAAMNVIAARGARAFDPVGDKP